MLKERIKAIKEISILYIDDEDEIIDVVSKNIKPLCKEFISANNGMEALNLYKDSIINNKLELIISDINMPNMDGITLSKKLKELNKDIEIVLVSGVSDVNSLIDSINLGISQFVLKPIKINVLIEIISDIAHKIIYERVISNQHYELDHYYNIINQVAIISRTDLKGNITYVNDIFSEVSGYSKDELIGKPHNIIRHPDTSKDIFKNMWQTISNNIEWKGKLKNRSKNGSDYYVFAYIFPLYNYNNNEKIGYIGIRYLITEQEMEKIDFKRKVLKSISEHKKKELELTQQINSYKSSLNQLEYLDFLKESIYKEKKKNISLVNKIELLEIELKNSRSNASTQLISLKNENNQIKDDLKQLASTLEFRATEITNLKNELKSREKIIVKFEERNTEQNKTIENLRDVISHKEDLISDLKGEKNGKN